MQPMSNTSKKEQNGTRNDKLSSLPDYILVIILSFLTTREAIQTSILSKRWINIWKKLPNLRVKSTQFINVEDFWYFLNNFLTRREQINNLRSIVVNYHGLIFGEILDRLFKYGTSHNVETITINAIGDGYYSRYFEIFNSMCPCHSIKYLDLSFGLERGKIILSHTLDLPGLTHCHLKEVSFLSKDNNGCLDPFSNCKKLTTLIIDSCILIRKTKLLVSNENISKLTMKFGYFYISELNIQLNTPNLKAFTFIGRLGTINSTYPFLEHDLPFLEEASLEIWFPIISKEIAETVMSWLQRFSNVYSMTLASSTARIIAYIPNFPNIEDVYFRNVESLILKNDPFAPSFTKEVMQFLVEKSRPNARITTSTEIPLYYAGRVKCCHGEPLQIILA